MFNTTENFKNPTKPKDSHFIYILGRQELATQVKV